MGKAMAHMAVVFAELERDFIRSRTREALALRRDHGVVLCRPRSTPDDVVARVVRERTEGKTAYAIARDLTRTLCRLRRVRAPDHKLRSARC
jgi:DNA invertase Pin-like site-specific DNA recombinase